MLNQTNLNLKNIDVVIPNALKQYEWELERLIHKVFPHGLSNNENLNLAKQLTLNWCASMCKKLGCESCLKTLKP